MATKPNITLTPADGWISVNTAASILVGNAFTLANIGVANVRYAEGAQPTDDSTYEMLYNPRFGSLSVLTVTSGAGEIWVKVTAGQGVLSVNG